MIFINGIIVVVFMLLRCLWNGLNDNQINLVFFLVSIA